MRTTGERIHPRHSPVYNVQAHWARYVWALRWADGRQVADIGCGCGYGAWLLSWRAAGVTAVDISGEALTFGCDAFGGRGIEWIRADWTTAIGTLPGGENGFGLVVCFEFLEHLADPAAGAQRIREIAAPGAHVAVSMPMQSAGGFHKVGAKAWGELAAWFEDWFGADGELYYQPRPSRDDRAAPVNIRPATDGHEPDAGHVLYHAVLPLA